MNWLKKDVKRRFLTKDEQKIFVNQANDSWYIEMYYVMLLSGLCVGEVGDLKCKDVDFVNKCINVNQALTCDYRD